MKKLKIMGKTSIGNLPIEVTDITDLVRVEGNPVRYETAALVRLQKEGPAEYRWAALDRVKRGDTTKFHYRFI